jgi:hypothetical protein
VTNKVIFHTVILTAALSLGAVIDRYVLTAAHDKKQIGFGADGNSPSASFPTAACTSATKDLEPIRAIIKEELAIALSAKPTRVKRGAEEPAAEAVVASPSLQQQETASQQEEAMQLLDALINNGTWGDEQRAQFQQIRGVLNPVQNEQAMQRLVEAVNNGHLRVSTTGPFF